ncbi:CAP domain-containing protein [Leucobacter sp. HY1910]
MEPMRTRFKTLLGVAATVAVASTMLVGGAGAAFATEVEVPVTPEAIAETTVENVDTASVSAETIRLHKSQMYTRTNVYREDHDVAPLKGNKRLDQLAQEKANEIIKNGLLRPSDFSTLLTNGEGWTGAAENLSTGYPDGNRNVFEWYRQDHDNSRGKMIDPTFNHVGFGIAYRGDHPYYVQILATNATATDYFEYDINADGSGDGGDNGDGGETTPPPAPMPFLDVKVGDKFYKEIKWMWDNKYTTGTSTPAGKMYFPKDNVTREAMAAFLFRADESSKTYKPNGKKPFADVGTNHKFYKEISWMKDMGYSTGTKLSNGTYVYKPKDSISREAMAAFLYRMTGVSGYVPSGHPYADMKPGAKFYKESVWMNDAGITTGVRLPNGKIGYTPKAPVTREAMAAFIHRYLT